MSKQTGQAGGISDSVLQGFPNFQAQDLKYNGAWDWKPPSTLEVT